MKSLKFFKPALAITLGIVLGWVLSVRPAQAGYTVTLRQVGPDVVATGSGAIDLRGLTFFQRTSRSPAITIGLGRFGIYTGPTSSMVDSYPLPGGGIPITSGQHTTVANSGSGNMVGMGPNLDDVG